jgi:hypothetical protein
MPCKHCDDGEGGCAYPYYGMAPHKHVGTEMAGSTVLDPKDEWPDNFSEDAESPGCGVWTECPVCGAPNAAVQEEPK